MPTNDDLTIISTSWPHSEFHQYRSDYESNYLKTLELAPGLAERVHEGQRVERFFGMSDSPNFFRKPYGPGWAPVGDAGYHKDPITVQGMTDAFRPEAALEPAVAG